MPMFIYQSNHDTYIVEADNHKAAVEALDEVCDFSARDEDDELCLAQGNVICIEGDPNYREVFTKKG